MTRSALLTLLVASAARAGVSDVAAPAPAPESAAQPAAPVTIASEPKAIDESTLQTHRTPFEVLSERLIGVAGRAVRYDWRNAHAGIGVTGAQLLELNDFGSARIGGTLRAPVIGLMVELSVTRVFTWGSNSTYQLSLTPYRQAARPSRIELDLNIAYPLAEAVTTARWGFLPPTELVFFVEAGFRYRFYPHQYDKTDGGEAFKEFFTPKLADREVLNLEYLRLPGMEIDRGRYDIMLGFVFDVYFQNGAFISPRVLFSPPLFSGIGGNNIGFWWELSLALGWMV